MRARRLPAEATRSAVTVIDSAVSSASNFVLSVAVANRVSTEDYARYALAFALFVFGYGIWRAYSSESFLLAEHKMNIPVGRVISSSSMVGLVVLVVGLGATALVDDTTAPIMLAFAVSMPFLAAHDGVRYGLIGRGQPHRALLLDLGWLALMPIGFVLADQTAHVVLGWSAASLPSLVVGWFMLGRPRLDGGLEWLRLNKSEGTRFAAEFVLFTGSLQFVLLAVGLTSGLDEMGAYRGAAVLVGPPMVVMAGLVTVALAAGRGDIDPRAVRTRLLTLSAVGAVAGVGLAGALALTPNVIGELLLGVSWATSRDAAIPLALSVSGVAVVSVASAIFRVIGDSKSGFRYRVGSLIAMSLAGTIGSIFGGATGAGTFMAIAGALGSVITIAALLRAIDELPHLPAVPADRMTEPAQSERAHSDTPEGLSA